MPTTNITISGPRLTERVDRQPTTGPRAWLSLLVVVLALGSHAGTGRAGVVSTTKLDDRLSFVVEEITSRDELRFWTAYSHIANRLAWLISRLRNGTTQGWNVPATFYSDVTQATKGFRDALDKHERRGFQLFVAYLTTKPDARDTSEKMRNIVMSMSVSSSEGFDVVVHMGIFRSLIYTYYQYLSEAQRDAVNKELLSRKDSDAIEAFLREVLTTSSATPSSVYKNQSLQLHAEAAKFMLTKGKKYLVTSPLPVMGAILKENGAHEGFDVYEMMAPARRLELRADDGTLLLAGPVAPAPVLSRGMSLDALVAQPDLVPDILSEFEAMFPWWQYATYNRREDRVWMSLADLTTAALAID